MNKKGSGEVIFFFFTLAAILMIGFIGVFVVVILDYGSDILTPIMTSLPDVGNLNTSEVGEFTFGTLDNFVQAFPWLIGVGYMFMIVFAFILALAFRVNPHPVFIGFYVMMVILLIFMAIFMSNMYENLITLGPSEITERMQEQTVMTYMILHAPIIMTILAFLCGIFFFLPKDSGGGVI